MSALSAVLVVSIGSAGFAQGRNPGKAPDAAPKHEEAKREEPKREEPRHVEAPAPRPIVHQEPVRHVEAPPAPQVAQRHSDPLRITPPPIGAGANSIVAGRNPISAAIPPVRREPAASPAIVAGAGGSGQTHHDLPPTWIGSSGHLGGGSHSGGGGSFGTTTYIDPQAAFAHSQEGKQYSGANTSYNHRPIGQPVIRNDYRYYAPRYGLAAQPSLYGVYLGICSPYIEAQRCDYTQPAVVWLDSPVDADNSNSDSAGLDRSKQFTVPSDEPGLRDAVDDIREAFLTGNIEPMVKLVDPNTHIAVFLKGKYDYSLPAGDYLDMTRDAIRDLETIAFRIDLVSRKAVGVYAISGKHVYRGVDGHEQTVSVSFVLEKIHDRWLLTQVGSAPIPVHEVALDENSN